MTNIITDSWIEQNKGLIWKAVNTYRKYDEDLFQIAIIGAIEASKKYSDDCGASFITYIFRGMKLAIRNELRKAEALMRNGHMNQCKLDDYALTFEVETIEDDVHSEMWVNHILTNTKLTEREKEVLHYHFIECLQTREIVPRMGVSRIRVNQLYNSAIKKVREQCERERI